MKIPLDLLQQCWFLAGPTASGKSALALQLALELGAEILAMDSMTVYRGMDIGTAKPTPEEQLLVPHHLLDLVDPHEEFSTAEYLKAAEASVRDLLERGKIPLFVGGTGLYLRSLLRGVFEGPAADWDYRRQLEAEALQQPPGWLLAQLAAVDPVTAARLHANDMRRLIRALEIQHLTGRPASEQHDEIPLPVDQRPKHVYWLSPQRDWLYQRINIRVEQMLSAGWLAEVDALRKLDPPIGRSAQQALGYRELLEFRAGAPGSLEEVCTLIQTRTRQFAKRQGTWFRNLEECQPLQIPSDRSDLIRQLTKEQS